MIHQTFPLYSHPALSANHIQVQIQGYVPDHDKGN